MPITFQVVPEKNYYVSLWEGEITDKEMLDSYVEFVQGSSWKSGQNEPLNPTKIGITSISSAGITALANYLQNLVKEGIISEFKTAVLSEDPFSDGIVKLYESLTRESPETIAIFR